MKRLSLFLFVSIVVIFSFGCKKNNDKPFEAGFLEEKYEDSFDWNTAHVIALEIHSGSDLMINVSSVDNTVRYHRGMHKGSDGVYRVQLSLPKIVEQIKVNQTTITVAPGVNRLDL